MEKRFRKISKFTIAVVSTALYCFLNTLKGMVISIDGYSTNFWLLEGLSLLLGGFIVYFFWTLVEQSRCSTVVNERVEK